MSCSYQKASQAVVHVWRIRLTFNITWFISRRNIINYGIYMPSTDCVRAHALSADEVLWTYNRLVISLKVLNVVNCVTIVLDIAGCIWYAHHFGHWMQFHLCKEIRILLSLVQCLRLVFCKQSNCVRSFSPYTGGIGSIVQNGVSYVSQTLGRCPT